LKIPDVTGKTPVLFSPANAEICGRLSPTEVGLVREIVSRAADKWSLWALSQLAVDGPLRFSRLLERVSGISQKSLTATLRQLARDGLVTRTVMVRSPIRVDYTATELGVELIRHIDPLWTWVASNHQAFAAARTSFETAQPSSCSSNSSKGGSRL
jgi:DNA-binding HxlR family transcriptional regulator